METPTLKTRLCTNRLILLPATEYRTRMRIGYFA